jgi:hypothetical protein
MKSTEGLLKLGAVIRRDLQLNELIAAFEKDPRFREGGSKATPAELRLFIEKWITEKDNVRPGTTALEYAESLFDFLMPSPSERLKEQIVDGWVHFDQLEDTPIPTEHIYDMLLTLSPLYKVDSLHRLRRVWNPAVSEDLVLRWLREIPIGRPNSYNIFKLWRTMEGNERSFTQRELEVFFSRSDVRITSRWINEYDPNRELTTFALKMRFGESYPERYAPTPGVNVTTGISSQIPDYVQKLLLQGGSVLSGGALLKIVSGGFKADLSPTYPDNLKSFITYMKPITVDDNTPQDYDIYTTRTPEEIYRYFYRLGFETFLERKYNVTFQADYTGWLLRFVRGPKGKEELVDVIFTNRGIDLQHRPPERPQDFIVKEFDIDITKIWYDGENVWVPNEQIARRIVQRRMELDFHPSMTINTHKTFTTMKRLLKYYVRGFSIDVTNQATFERFLDSYAEKLIDHGISGMDGLGLKNQIFNPAFFQEIIERYLNIVARDKEPFLNYNEYFIRSRNNRYFDDTPLPKTPDYPMPRTFNRTRYLLSKMLDRFPAIPLEEIDNVFVQRLGIHFYEVAGGDFMYDYIGPYLLDAQPFFLYDSGLILTQDVKMRKYRVTSEDLPECKELFASKPQSTEEFKTDLGKFIARCTELDAEPPCKEYLTIMKASIVNLYVYSFLDYNWQVGLPTMVTRRGIELFTAFENMDRQVAVPHSYVYVRYENEPGIDAGGLRKEFYVNVCRQMKPLFSFLNPGASDPRMYISDAPKADIITALNRGVRPDMKVTLFDEDDLQPLYYLAGKMFADAFVNGYSTEIPLSRALLAAMVTDDGGVDLSYLKTAYLMEQGSADPLENLYFYDMDHPRDSEEVLEDLAIERYFADKKDPRFTYVRNFVRGFSSMGRVLNVFNITPKELFSSVCSTNVTRELFENYIKSSITIYLHTTKYSDGSETKARRIERDGSPYRPLVLKLWDFLFNRPEDLATALKMNFPEQFPRNQTTNSTLVRYYQLVLEGITNLNVLDVTKELTFDFFQPAPTTQVVTQISIHNCFDSIEISIPWFTNIDLEGWVVVTTGGFLEKKYTTA